MNDCGISKLDLKRRNRMQILKVVREQGPISRVDISAILGITRAAVTIITNEMIDQHILQEVGEEPVNPNAEVRKGRRKILLDINETYKFAIGIYVDEKEISIGLTTLNAAALDKRSITHKADMTPEALAELLGTTLEKMLQNSCLTYENLLGIGVCNKGNMLDKDGKLPQIKPALMADAVATSAGAILGTSTTTTFVESASGVTEGGRTGLTSMTTGVLFLLATIFSPLFLTIPSFATAPALIIVGFYMMGSAVKIDFNDPSEGIPAFLTILAMPTAYSISEGIAIGVISWTIINVVTGKAKEKKISPLMYVLTVLFILKYICL